MLYEVITNVICLVLPSLRERRGDIPLLIEHFYEKMTGKKGLKVTEEAMRLLLDYHWPGNIRELENIIERCVVLGPSGELTADSLPPQLRSSGGSVEGPSGWIPDARNNFV